MEGLRGTGWSSKPNHWLGGAERSPEKYKKQDHTGHLYACILPVRTSRSCHKTSPKISVLRKKEKTCLQL